MHSVSLGVPVEVVATEKQPDACEFFNRYRDKHVVTISAQGTNEITYKKLPDYPLLLAWGDLLYGPLDQT